MSTLLAALLLMAGVWLAYDGLTAPPRPRRPHARRPNYLERRLEEAGLPRARWREFLAVSVLLALGGYAAAYLLSGGLPAVGLAGSAAGGASLFMYLSRKADARRDALQQALAEATAQLRQSLRSGFSLELALEQLAQLGPPLLRRDFARLVAEAEHLDFETALRRMRDRLADPLFDMLAVVLKVNRRHGGSNLGAVLARLAGATQEELAIARSIRAQQTSARLSACLICTMPFGLLALINQLNPGYLLFFRTPLGAALLALCLPWILGVYVVLRLVTALPRDRRLVRSAFPPVPPAAGAAAFTAGAPPVPPELSGRVLLAAVLLALGAYLAATYRPPRPSLEDRLARLDPGRRRTPEDPEPYPLFGSRLLGYVLRDATRGLARPLERLGRGGEELDRALALARPDWTRETYLAQKLGSAAACSAAGALLALAALGAVPAWSWLLPFLPGLFLPDARLRRELAARRAEILMELPVVLEMLALTVTAGEGDHAALIEVVEDLEGPVAEELGRALSEMQVGSGAEDALVSALRRVAARNAVTELSVFVDRFTVSRKLGLPLAEALAVQADELRERKRLRIVEAGERSRVKVAIPVGMSLPVFLVVVLAPAAAQLFQIGG